MSREPQLPPVLRFASFEVDLRAGELRKQGVRLKLQEQPFQVLKILLARPGEIVSREDLRSQIWSADTFVDFDNSLNTAINKLREVLGDSAASPRFIETVPKRGYRFIASGVDVDGRNAVATEARSRRLKVVVPAAALAIALVAGGAYWRLHQAHRLTENDTIVLTDFTNTTEDPVFDGTLRAGLSVQLEQSPFLSLVPEEQIRDTLLMMKQQSNARLTPEIAREVCLRTSSAATMEGSIGLIGTRYNLILKAISCPDGRVLASAERQASDKTHVLDALEQVASEMRRKLGESLSTVQKYNTPLEKAATPSLEALQAYSFGTEAEVAGQNAAALSFFQRAVQLDPNFAEAYDEMGNMHGVMGETALAAQEIGKAFQLRAGLSESERLTIEADYYTSTTGDLIKVREICEQGTTFYDGSAKQSQVWFHAGLAGVSTALGQHDISLKESLQAVHLRPSTALLYRGVLRSYMDLERVGEAEAVAKEARAKGLDSHLSGVLYGIAFYRDDSIGMEQEVARVRGVPGEEDLLVAMEADTAAYFGQLEKARELSRRAADFAGLLSEKETVAGYYAVSALREALFGNELQARQQVARAKRDSKWRDAEYGVALALAYAARDSEARSLADDLGKRFPEDTTVQFNYLPTLRAKLALDHSNPQLALELLSANVPFELGLPSASYYNWPNLYPVYVRGEAYLAAHQGDQAATEFEKILDHRGIVLNEPIGVLAHLGLARAYFLQGDMVKSRAAYQDFLTLWRDADPDIPVLKAARSEYAKLQ